MIKAVALLALIGLAVACSRPAESSAPVATDQCAAPDMPALQGGDHLIGDREPPVPYSSSPPTSGWHSSGTFEIGVQPPADPLSEPEQVSVLEAGGVVVTYNDISSDDQATLEEHVAESYEGRVAVTAYDKLAPATIAFTGWGVRQACDGVDLEALDRFVTTYADEQPASPGDQ